jgi:predicted HTH domain antitoxin
MSQTLTVELPDELARRARSVAAAGKRRLEDAVIDWISQAVAEPEIEGFPGQLRLAAAIFWYDRGLISQGKGAEIAGLTRAEFIDALGRANVSAIQTSVEELQAELERGLNARR